MVDPTTLARDIYAHHRRARLKAKRAVRVPPWDELDAATRAERILAAARLASAYGWPHI